MNIAVILISGKGTRVGGDIPKQFILKNGMPIYLYSVFAFEKNKHIDRILLVTSSESINAVKCDVENFKVKKIIDVIEGGEKRYDSSFLALKYLKDNNYSKTDNILIHDGVRCNVSQSIINRNIACLKRSDAVLTAIRGHKQKERVDTYHKLNEREYLAQTPQSFVLELIYSLFLMYFDSKNDDITDDISLCELFGCHYIISRGSKKNYKITYSDDLEKFLRD